MNYYIYKNENSDIVGYRQTEEIAQPPAIEVTEEEYIELGFYIGVIPPSTLTLETIEEQVTELETVVDTLMEGII